MRIENLTNIKTYLSPIVESKGYFIYIAPLNKQHYCNFIALIKERTCITKSFEEIVTDRNNLIELSKQIVANIKILVDTNLYVSKKNSSTIDDNYELIDFLRDKHIDYKAFIGSNNLINELKQKPKDELNN
jgi:hypothetical protein